MSHYRGGVYGGVPQYIPAQHPHHKEQVDEAEDSVASTRSIYRFRPDRTGSLTAGYSVRCRFVHPQQRNVQDRGLRPGSSF